MTEKIEDGSNGDVAIDQYHRYEVKSKFLLMTHI